MLAVTEIILYSSLPDEKKISLMFLNRISGTLGMVRISTDRYVLKRNAGKGKEPTSIDLGQDLPGAIARLCEMARNEK